MPTVPNIDAAESANAFDAMLPELQSRAARMARRYPPKMRRDAADDALGAMYLNHAQATAKVLDTDQGRRFYGIYCDRAAAQMSPGEYSAKQASRARLAGMFGGDGSWAQVVSVLAKQADPDDLAHGLDLIAQRHPDVWSEYELEQRAR